MSLIPAYLLSLSHSLVGIGLFSAPLTMAQLFGMTAVPSTVFVSRMLGSRDLVFGIGIFMAITTHQQHLTATLFLTNITNGIDILSVLISYAEGNLTVKAFALLAGAAALVLGEGLWALSSLGRRVG
ncbi:hypothetical protein LTR10_009623 [Elasticomyces elasticus]|nr:hypothetical protein LTR10_009623 [Elasticomyces elasticus]KAK4971281.1 hypothetical protein LTR42_007007 [Elasticomyces elasticus]